MTVDRQGFETVFKFEVGMKVAFPWSGKPFQFGIVEGVVAKDDEGTGIQEGAALVRDIDTEVRCVVSEMDAWLLDDEGWEKRDTY